MKRHPTKWGKVFIRHVTRTGLVPECTELSLLGRTTRFKKGEGWVAGTWPGLSLAGCPGRADHDH